MSEDWDDEDTGAPAVVSISNDVFDSSTTSLTEKKPSTGFGTRWSNTSDHANDDNEWNDESSSKSGFGAGFGTSRGAFGSRGGMSNGDDGFGRRGGRGGRGGFRSLDGDDDSFSSRGRGRGGRGGFGGRNNSDNDDSFGGGGFGHSRGGFKSSNENGDDSNSGGFRGRRGGGFGSRGGFNSAEDGEDSGSRRGRGGLGGNRRGGFGSSNDNEDGESGGFGGGRGRGGGFGGRRGGFNSGNDDNQDGESSGGFGRGRGRGGFGGSRRGGFGSSNDDGEDSGGFGSSRGRGGFGGSRRGGFGSSNGDGEESSGGGFGSRRGGFGGGFKSSNDEDGEQSGGFGGRRSGGFGGFRGDDDGDGDSRGRGRGRGRGGRGGSRSDDDGNIDPSEFSDSKPPRELYIPPDLPEDEETVFSSLAAGINFSKYDDIPVELTGRDPPTAINTFEEAGLFDTLRSNVEKSHYEKPTPVQKNSIPVVLGGRDLMACAQTGSGKTAAFLLPVLTAMVRDGVQGGEQNEVQAPTALVIGPTRELVLQIYGEARKFARDTIIKCVVVYGGTSVGYQLSVLERGCHILVATPGRLVDFLNRKKVILDNLKYFILDEADRMLDMGFGPEIKKVVTNYTMPSKENRQTLMFSATFPEEVQQIASEYLNDYVFLTVGRVGSTTSDIEQHVMQLQEYDKREKLCEILNQSSSDRILVFVETKRSADFLASYLSQEGFPTTSIHGDRLQREREEALRDFRSGRNPVLVATAVAARGLDIPNVKHVINYDLPSSIDEYVHRIGRTGRLGNKGKATAFFQVDKDSSLARSLVKILSDATQDVPDWLEEVASGAVGSNYGPQGGSFASRDTRQQFRGGRGRGGRGGGRGSHDGGFGDSGGDLERGFGSMSFGSSTAVAENDEEWD
ncbi:ATP-dependent RNA helicase DDX4-like [Dysidea avara]|uniref:ATP-dependent RNA helicase DDX4-like n=1 Tax=Dysidea avara TaxID=196820 RepID=UPI003324A4CA